MTNRNTLRVDGLTVGEAMEREAEFLGVTSVSDDDAKDAFKERTRQAVLAALDSLTPDGEKGWTDQELPALFKVIDAQSLNIFNRLQSLNQKPL